MSQSTQSQRNAAELFSTSQVARALCLQCGMCCNGVLFADVRSERGDPSPLFERHGSRVAQPCPAFNFTTCACAIYADRPARCRKFECAQFIGVRDGTVAVQEALLQIRTARRLTGKIEKLLDRLGFNEARLPLKRRFEKCQRAVGQGKIPAADLAVLARLQLAFHQLSLLLAEKFF